MVVDVSSFNCVEFCSRTSYNDLGKCEIPSRIPILVNASSRKIAFGLQKLKMGLEKKGILCNILLEVDTGCLFCIQEVYVNLKMFSGLYSLKISLKDTLQCLVIKDVLVNLNKSSGSFKFSDSILCVYENSWKPLYKEWVDRTEGLNINYNILTNGGVLW